MKRKIHTILFVLAVDAFLLGPVVALGAPDASTCYTISSPDARTYCLARAHKEASRCYAIQDTHLRALCLAEVR